MIAAPLLATSLLALGAMASPQHLSPREISVSPQITDPTAETTWQVGEEVSVRWATDDLHGADNQPGELWLVEPEENTSKYYINKPVPLAKDFTLGEGEIHFEVPPWVSHYCPTSLFALNLAGSSGNISPPFKILTVNGNEMQRGSADDCYIH